MLIPLCKQTGDCLLLGFQSRLSHQSNSDCIVMTFKLLLKQISVYTVTVMTNPGNYSLCYLTNYQYIFIRIFKLKLSVKNKQRNKLTNLDKCRKMSKMLK